MQISLFEALVMTHFIVDWIFQWRWETMNKSKKLAPLLFHSGVYSLGFIPVFLIYNIHFSWLILLFFSHVFLDSRKFEIWLLEKFKGVKRREIPECLWWILLIGIDQILHITVLAILVIFN
mgnify:CR=1 FL=1